MIILTSDNGGADYIRLKDINKPFRGWKMTFFEGGIHVPMFIKWPRMIAKNLQMNSIVSHIDLHPTIISAATGLYNLSESDPLHNKVTNMLRNISVQGKDLIPFIMKYQNEHLKPIDVVGEGCPLKDDNTCESDNNMISTTNDTIPTGSMISDIDSVLLPEFHQDVHTHLYWRSGHYKCLRYGKWKLQVSSNPPKHWLFDLSTDLNEANNLAYVKEFQHVRKAMEQILRNENDAQATPLWPAVLESHMHIDPSPDHLPSSKTLEDCPHSSIGAENHYPQNCREFVFWAN
jgi:uncharacterized sulfatase